MDVDAANSWMNNFADFDRDWRHVWLQPALQFQHPCHISLPNSSCHGQTLETIWILHEVQSAHYLIKCVEDISYFNDTDSTLYEKLNTWDSNNACSTVNMCNVCLNQYLVIRCTVYSTMLCVRSCLLYYWMHRNMTLNLWPKQDSSLMRLNRMDQGVINGFMSGQNLTVFHY